MKKSRQSEILNLIEERSIETQEELCQCLRNMGYDVTQATVSRDIRELKLSKMVGTDGKQHYVRLGETHYTAEDDRRHNTILREAVKKVDYARNMIVIKCNAGMAPAVGSAVDAMKETTMVGSIAGDDTVLCVMRTDEDAENFSEKLAVLLKN